MGAGLIVLGAVLGLGLSARPAEAAPFAYVVYNGVIISEIGIFFISAVSVIDTATNKVVDTIGVGTGANSVAVAPDGKHVYLTGSTVSVIDTATNTVVATVPVEGAVGVHSGWETRLSHGELRFGDRHGHQHGGGHGPGGGG